MSGPENDRPAEDPERSDDVQEVPIGLPISDEEFRRLKERARSPSEEPPADAEDEHDPREEE
jgi:hypothetical protein